MKKSMTQALLKNDIVYHSDLRPPKPVLKWAGGKTQLLSEILKRLPDFVSNKIEHYIEPFFGGGAGFFEFYNQNLIKTATILDINPDLITLYKTIQQVPNDLIDILYTYQHHYSPLCHEKRTESYYKIRTEFNQSTQKSVGINPVRSAQVVFLNRTCFNGLFRVNKKSEFNVPHGLYKNPKILDSDNIMSVSQAFQIADIIHGDFTIIKNMVNKPTFIYYDPPYRPLSSTSNFNAYAGEFSDTDQKRLGNFYKNMSGQNIFQMLSNSDPFSHCQDLFFDTLYSDFNIFRIEAKRIINANADKRGKIFELLITDYDTN
jgi:DNA adenine methylase